MIEQPHADRAIETIERLQESEAWHVLDVVPHQSQSAAFLDYEAYLEASPYIAEFSSSVHFIALALVAEYPCGIFLTESEEFFAAHSHLQPFTDLRALSFEELSELMDDVVTLQQTSMQILFPDTPALLSIDGGFSVTVHNASNEMLTLIGLLAERHGLFLKYHDDAGRVSLYRPPSA